MRVFAVCSLFITRKARETVHDTFKNSLEKRSQERSNRWAFVNVHSGQNKKKVPCTHTTVNVIVCVIVSRSVSVTVTVTVIVAMTVSVSVTMTDTVTFTSP